MSELVNIQQPTLHLSHVMLAAVTVNNNPSSLQQVSIIYIHVFTVCFNQCSLCHDNAKCINFHNMSGDKNNCSTDTHPAVRTHSTLSHTCWGKVRHYITIGTSGLGEGTNLCKAESHSVWVMVLRNEDAGHKVLEFISKAICHHDDQAECENQGLQCVIGWKSLHRWAAPSSPPTPCTAHRNRDESYEMQENHVFV